MTFVDPSAPWNDGDPATPLTAARLNATVAALGAYADALQTDVAQGLPGLIVPCGLPVKASTITPTANKAYYVRFPCPRDGFVVKSFNLAVTEKASANDAVASAIFAADGKTVLASSGEVKSLMNVEGTRNVPLSTTFEGGKKGTIYYAVFQYGTIGGTAAVLGSAGFTSAKLASIAGSEAGLILLATTTPTFPLATQPSIATATVAEVPMMFLKST